MSQTRILSDASQFFYHTKITKVSDILYRQPITLTGGASGEQTDYQMLFDVTYNAHMKANFDDLRFYKLDGVTPLDAWLESKIDSTSAKIWVETDTPANTVEADIYMYYGNSGASSNWSIDNTFIFGDDFEGSTLDSNKWNQDYAGCSSTVVVENSYLKLDCGSGCGGNLQRMLGSINQYTSDNVVLRTKHKVNAGGSARSQTWRSDTRLPSGVGNDYQFIFTPSSTRDYDVLLESHINGSSQSKNCCNDVYSQNTWYTFDMLRSGNDYEILVDDVSKITDTRSGLSTNNMYIILGMWADGPIYWDYILLHKYAANPATYSFGSEESAPILPGHPTMRRWGGIPGMRFTGRNSW